MNGFSDDDIQDRIIAVVMDLLDSDSSSSSDESCFESEMYVCGGGSRPGRRPNKDRGRKEGAIRLHLDYFAASPVYDSRDFRRRFRMNKALFMRIHDALLKEDDYFVQRADACQVMGLNSFQKITAALRMISYGLSADAVDDTLRMSGSTVLESLKHFAQGVISKFGDEYLRSPREADLKRILTTNANRGFVGMLGSVDCMHWVWKNCPKAWAGQFKGKEKKPTIVAEAVVSYDLWFWHFYFGVPGSNNDINVLDRSPLFDDLLQGKTAKVDYTINGNSYSEGYYLADGIYPRFSAFVKTIAQPQDAKCAHFSKMQESARKDVERAFGVLQARFQIIDRPCKLWCPGAMKTVITACVILHNMIVEDERDHYAYTQHYLADNPDRVPISLAPADHLPRTAARIRSALRSLQDERTHIQLQNDLVEHLWCLKGVGEIHE